MNPAGQSLPSSRPRRSSRRLRFCPIQALAFGAQPISAVAYRPLGLRYRARRAARGVVVVHALFLWLYHFIHRVKCGNQSHNYCLPQQNQLRSGPLELAGSTKAVFALDRLQHRTALI